MPEIRKARDASAKTQGAGQREIHGEPTELQQVPRPMDQDIAQQAKLETRFLVSQVATRACQSCDFEATTPIEGVSPATLGPHPEWSALDSESSVMGSLLALNEHLMAFERLRRSS